MDDWDETKRQSNLTKHGLDFARFIRFDWDRADFADEQVVDGERREAVVGMLDGELVVAIHTEREDGLRLISLHKATPSEATPSERKRWSGRGRTR